MGITKAFKFNSEQNKLAQYFKVFGHPARIAIIQYIIQKRACICGDLVDELGLAQATISQHLNELKSVGLIQGSIEGKTMCYCIDEKVWNDMQKDIARFFSQSVQVENCCI